MIEWLESTERRRMPGLGWRAAPTSGILHVKPVTVIESDSATRYLIDWSSGGWVRVDQEGALDIQALDGRDVSKVEIPTVEALWNRGLITIAGLEPFSDDQFAEDLRSSREYYTLVFVLAPGCNLVCSYCYLGHDQPSRSRQFPVSEAVRLFDEALTLGYPGVLVDFGEISVAGELFVELLSKFRDMARASGTPAWFSVQTNGTTVTRELCETIGGDDLLMSFSVDGPASAHDAARTYRNGAGSHAQAVRAVRLAQEAGIKTNLIATIAQHNVEQPSAVVAELLALGSSRYLLKPVLEQGEASGSWGNIGVTPERYARFVIEAAEAGFREGIAGLDQTALKFLLRICGVPTGWRDACTSRWCGSGRDLHVLTADGGVHSCPRFVEPAAPLAAVEVRLRTKPTLKRDLLEGELRHPHSSCDGCAWYRTCGGGCTLAGGLSARDDNCDSYLALFDLLMRKVVPCLLADPAGEARSLGVAVRRLPSLAARLR